MIEQIRCSRLVGRAVELETLLERFKESRLGRGSIVFVSGEAGIGKTRLIDEALRRAEAMSMRHARGFCLEHARTPLGPLADIVRTLHADDDSVLTVARNVRRILARLVPELEYGSGPDIEVQGARSQYAAIAEMFRRYGERHPCVLVIEDAHWADVSTTEFLKYFAAKVADSHVVLLVVSRLHVLNSTEFSPLKTELRRHHAMHALDLEPLPPAEMQLFLHLALGSQHLDAEHLRNIRQLADGNPLFAEELLASALAQRAGHHALPATIREMFLERIGRLDVDDRDVLVEAAVIGRRFDPAFLAQLTRRPLERILLALRRARALQLVVEDGEHVEDVVFRHALVRETLYESILFAEARGMHRRILRELEALPDRKQRIAALAYHSWSAGESATALTYNELAGDEAMGQLATNDAAVFYERALACISEPGDRRARLALKLGDAYSSSGWSSRAIDTYESVYAFARRNSDLETMSRVCSAISTQYSARGEGDAHLRWQMASLEAVESMPASSAWFTAHARAALGYAWRGEADQAARVIAVAETFDGDRTLDAAQSLHDAYAYVDLAAGRYVDALAQYERAAALAIESGNAAVATRALINMGDAAKVVGHYDIAQRVLEHAIRITDEDFVPLYRPYVLTDSALLHVEMGELDAARRRFAQAEDAAAGLDAPRLHSQLVRVGLVLARVSGDAALAERYADERVIDYAFLSREPWWVGSIAGVFAERFGHLGRTADAQRLVQRALATLPSIVRSHELALTAAVWGADGDIHRAREQLVVWASLAREEFGRAFVALFDAHVARRAGRSPAAAAGRAAESFAALGLPLWSASALELAGERAAALQTYLRIGSKGDIARLTKPHTLQFDDAQLTKREREVLFHVTGGRSNREIADELSLSERTVESHIRAILGKIGGRSRHDIIRLADLRVLR